MFSHAQSLLIQTQKDFLSVLGVFGKYFAFTKTQNFKNSVALFWQLNCGSDKSHVIVAFS